MENEAAYRLDPLSPPTIRSLGNVYFFGGRFEEALAHWKKTIERAPIDSYRGLADLYMLKGDFEQAELMVKELERLAPGQRLGSPLPGLAFGGDGRPSHRDEDDREASGNLSRGVRAPILGRIRLLCTWRP